MRIERDVPLPPPRPNKTPWWSDSLRKLQPGDSFLLPPERIKERDWAYRIAQNLGIKICMRTTDDGLRLWRLA